MPVEGATPLQNRSTCETVGCCGRTRGVARAITMFIRVSYHQTVGFEMPLPNRKAGELQYPVPRAGLSRAFICPRDL
eukprot:5311694-Prymnesium_polylepis.1